MTSQGQTFPPGTVSGHQFSTFVWGVRRSRSGYVPWNVGSFCFSSTLVALDKDSLSTPQLGLWTLEVNCVQRYPQSCPPVQILPVVPISSSREKTTCPWSNPGARPGFRTRLSGPVSLRLPLSREHKCPGGPVPWGLAGFRLSLPGRSRDAGKVPQGQGRHKVPINSERSWVVVLESLTDHLGQ